MMRGNKSKNKSRRFIIDEQFIDVGPKFDKKDIPEDEVESFNFNEYSYKLLSEKISFLFPRLGGLRTKLFKSNIGVYYEAYVCGVVLASIIAGIIGLIAGIIVSLLVTLEPAFLEFALPLLIALITGQLTFGIMYMMPSIKLKSRTSRLLGELPYYIGYMATLSSSGLNLQGVFRAISWEESDSELVKDAQRLIQNLDMLGMDVSEALRDLIDRSPAPSYTELLEGLVTTVMAGGDTKEYFTSFAKIQLEEKKIMIKKSTAALGMLSELYTILLIVFPLLGSIILSVMGMMTPNLGGFDLGFLMTILTFGLVPALGSMMLFMLDAMVPKR